MDAADRRLRTHAVRRAVALGVIGVVAVLVVGYVAFNALDGDSSPAPSPRERAGAGDYDLRLTKCEGAPDGAGVAVQGEILNRTDQRQTFTIQVRVRVGDQTVTALPRAPFVKAGERRHIGSFVALPIPSHEPASCSEFRVDRRRG